MHKIARALLDRLYQLGAAHKLSFSGQQLLNGCVLGFDGPNRRVLVVRKANGNSYEEDFIDLAEVETCCVKKSYGSIQAGAFKKGRMNEYLRFISLCFEFRTGKRPSEIPFYHHRDNSSQDIRELEQKARNWQVLLSKLLPGSFRHKA